MNRNYFYHVAFLLIGVSPNISFATISNLTTDMSRIRDITFRLNGRSIEFPDEMMCDIHKQDGHFISKNIIATRMQMFGYDAIICQPRYKRGVPATLVSASLKDGKNFLKTKAFPDWKTQQIGNCDAMQSAVDLFMDKNNKLWVLDAGTVDIMDRPSNKCPPKIVCIDMLTKKISKTIELNDYCNEKSGVQFIVAENGPDGNDHVYVSDASGKAIIVINAKSGKGKRLSLRSMLPECSEDCALYLTLLMKGDFKNYLYLTYANCPEIYSIETSLIHLKKEIEEESSETCSQSCQRQDEDIKKIHCLKVAAMKPKNYYVTFSGTDGLSRLYFRKYNSNEIYTWDANTPMNLESCALTQKGSSDRIITQVTPGPWKLLWYLESNANDYISGKTGCLGASTIIRPIAKEVDKKLLSLESLLKLK